MAPPTLVSLATKACIKRLHNIHDGLPPIDDVGDFEYWKIRDVLKHVKNPDQLREIELNSPQIMGEDAELWQKFIAKVDPKWEEKNYYPKDPTKWYNVYKRYKKEAEAKLKEDEENLFNAMMGLGKEKASHTSQLVDTKSLPRLPRDPRMPRHNGGVLLGGKNSTTHQRSRNDSVLSWGTGSKTKTNDPRGVLLRARREAKEISMRAKLGVPSNQLKNRNVQQQAPASMVDTYRRAANVPLKIHTPTRSRPTTGGGESNRRQAEADAAEKRLRALTSGRTQASQPSGLSKSRHVDFSSDSGSDDIIGKNAPTRPGKPVMFSDDEESDLEDLFDEEPSPPKKSITRPPPAPRAKDENMKPSDFISSLASKKPSSIPSSSTKPREILKAVPPRPRPATVGAKSMNPMASSANPSQRSGSPAVPAAAAPKPPMKKRAAVDIFNRQAKKPRRP